MNYIHAWYVHVYIVHVLESNLDWVLLNQTLFVCVHETHCTCHKNSYSIASVDCTFPSSVFIVVYLYMFVALISGSWF